MVENKVSGCLIEKKGRYYAVIYYYENGVRQTKTKATGITVSSHKKKVAEGIKDNIIAAKQAEIDKQAEKEEQQKTMHSFADYLERWVEYKATQIEKTTAAGYRNGIKTPVEYFREREMMIETIQPIDIRTYYEWALKNGRRNVYKEGASRELSRRTVSDQARVIKAFLNDAVVAGIITINPADKVTVPRVKTKKVKEVSYMELDEAKTFLKYIKDIPMFNILYYICVFGFYYGMRRSELLGLKWNAINFEKKGFEIRRTVTRADNEVIHSEDVKTDESHRYYPLLGEVEKALLELREHQEELGIYSPDGYIFLWDDGREYDPDYISKLFKKAVTRCEGVPKSVTLHGLRHSACAILFQSGWSLGEVQNWLGHADIAVTANIYNHVSKRWKNQHGKKIDGFFGISD